jgi:hypothetical protein
MLAILEGTTRIQLHILINIRGANHSQVIHILINPHTRSILGRTYHQLFLTPGTQELAPLITLPTYNPSKGIIGRRADNLQWAVVLLHNVDTLEVLEEAIRQAGANEPAEPASHQAQEAGEGTSTVSYHSGRNMPHANGNNNRRGGGRGPQPRPVKSQDPAKKHRKAEHEQRTAAAAAVRRAEGAAREAALLAPITEDPPLTNIETILPPLPQHPHAHLALPPSQPETQPLLTPPHNPSDQPRDPTLVTTPDGKNDEVFYETEQELENDNEELFDGELELPRSSQISGNKELQQDPPEDEATSKKTRKADSTNPILNE